MRRTTFVGLAFACALTAALVVGPAFALAVPVLTGTETRLSDSIGDEYDPAINGNTVVYTSNRSINTNVFYYDLETSTEHQVTTDAGNQELADMWGGTIAYTDLVTADVLLYDIPTSVTTNLTAAANSISMNPGISDRIVAWEDRRHGNLELYARDLATAEERRITNCL